jgi:uncharacterized membrane protein
MSELIVLRLVHVVGGIFWVGSAILTTFFLMPALAGVGPSAAQVMAALQRRRLFTALPVAAVLTILSGLRLMWLTSGGLAPGYLSSARGGTYAASGAAAIGAFILALAVVRPAAVRAGELGAKLGATATPEERAQVTAELARLRQRSALLGTVVAWVLILSAAGMAVARYLV